MVWRAEGGSRKIERRDQLLLGRALLVKERDERTFSFFSTFSFEAVLFFLGVKSINDEYSETFPASSSSSSILAAEDSKLEGLDGRGGTS